MTPWSNVIVFFFFFSFFLNLYSDTSINIDDLPGHIYNGCNVEQAEDSNDFECVASVFENQNSLSSSSVGTLARDAFRDQG